MLCVDEIANCISAQQVNRIWPILYRFDCDEPLAHVRVQIRLIEPLSCLVSGLWHTPLWPHNEFPVHCALYPLLHLPRCRLLRQTKLSALFRFKIEQMLSNTPICRNPNHSLIQAAGDGSSLRINDNGFEQRI